MSLRVLIFGTSWVDTPERLRLIRQWAVLHKALNPACDRLIVDSASPELWSADGAQIPGALDGVDIVSFSDNIGHLSNGGKDGWGRAFCRGVRTAIEFDYDFVGHIECDSLFRLPVMPIVEQMALSDTDVASVPIGYGEAQRSTWVETGLIFVNVDYLRKSNFIAGYDWPNRTARPQPEIVIRRMLGDDLVMLPLKAERSDKGEITVDNVHEFDWITHCKPEVYDRFIEYAMAPWSCTLDPDCLCFRSTYLNCPYRK